ncbi:Calcium-transporting ATPase 10, plasma membrane-type, partial [Clydaea vesicula]
MSFTLEPNQLVDFVEPKSPQKLVEYGGVEKVAVALKTDLNNGLSSTSNDAVIIHTDTQPHLENNDKKSIPTATNNVFNERIHFYGTNTLPPPKSKSFFQFSWEAAGDRTLQILVVAAITEIAVGIYKIVKSKETAGIWDGLAIVFAVIIIILITAGNDYRKQSQFRQLNEFSRGLAQTKVIRNGHTVQIKNSDLLVGDIALIDTGDILPADGIYISGSHLKCDESSLTGESNVVAKDEVKDPFLLSGTKVVNGVGKMLIIGTGVNSINGRIMMTLTNEAEATPLQKKLDFIANQIGKFGLAAAILMVVVLVVSYFAINPRFDQIKIADDMINIIMSAITLVVVAIPEGLPLAVTMALAHATLRMLKDNNLVRHLSSCETMGNATTICSDKTGTLTLNQMAVVKGCIFNTDFTKNDRTASFDSKIFSTRSKQHKDNLLAFLSNSLNVNSSADETENEEGKINFNGSKTEIALLDFTKSLGYEYKKDRKNTEIIDLIPFSSDNKKMTTTVKLAGNKIFEAFQKDFSEFGELFIYSKGAAEIVLSTCDKFVNDQGIIQEMAPEKLKIFQLLIESYASQALRTIAFGFKPFNSSNKSNLEIPVNDMITLSTTDPLVYSGDGFKEDPSKSGMILLGIVGIEDPVRPEVPDAVKSCQRAGVVVRMVTGDNKATARSIAKQCGILTDGGVVMEGPDFRKLSREEMDAIVPKLQVLARSSPLDKQILVNTLKSMYHNINGIGETVAVTGDGTNDAPALKSAD